MMGELLEGYIAKWRQYPDDELERQVCYPNPLEPSFWLLKDSVASDNFGGI